VKRELTKFFLLTLVMSSLILLPMITISLSEERSENQFESRVHPASWYGFYIDSNTSSTIIIMLNITSGEETHFYIVDDADFALLANGTGFPYHTYYAFSDNLTLNFIVPYSGTWYFIIFNAFGISNTVIHVQGLVFPSPDGYVEKSTLIDWPALTTFFGIMILPVILCSVVEMKVQKTLELEE